CIEFHVDVEFPRRHIVLESAQSRQSSSRRPLMDYQQASQLQAGNGSVQDSAAAPRNRYGFDESVPLLDELSEGAKDPCVTFPADFVDDEHEAREAASNPCCGVDECVRRQRNTEHYTLSPTLTPSAR